MALSVASSDGLELLDGVVLGEDAELNLIAGQVQESWSWYEKLADDRMYKAEQARSGDVHQR